LGDWRWILRTKGPRGQIRFYETVLDYIKTDQSLTTRENYFFSKPTEFLGSIREAAKKLFEVVANFMHRRQMGL
jgi:hypothetical protein